LPSELNAAFLYAQLEKAYEINNQRLGSWKIYNDELKSLGGTGLIELPHIPADCDHNAHMYYIKTRNIAERTNLVNFLKQNNVASVFHYIPLHSAPAGLKFSVFHGIDKYTTTDSERLLRLPMYYGLTPEECKFVAARVKEFYKNK
jgi:dTDP-4-amino-4,6-dideoxygalactose transaminase